MSDFRNYDYRRNPDDPTGRNASADPDQRAANAAWGWIAAAVFVVVVLAVVFGIEHQPGQQGTNTASNEVAPPPAVTHMNPPTASPMSPPTASPQPAAPAPPVTPTPNPPGQQDH